MAPFPEEVDVFSAPHWRMKELVSRYSEKLSNTNFSSSRDFQALLTSLYATFTEFKSHEQIENEYIMGELQHRLRALSVRNRSVSAVHSDNKLCEMLQLFEKGLKNIKNECEQLRYSRHLKEQLDAFTKEFIPHMKEEEEVFQPLLMEYFTYEELKDIKTKVIARHCSQGPPVALQVLNEFPLWTPDQNVHTQPKNAHGKRARTEPWPEANNTHVSQLPPEVLVKILGYLNPRDLCRSSQVNRHWAQVARSGALWRHLYPVSWAREESGHRAQGEAQLLQGIVHHLLPEVGPAVRSLVLADSSTLSSQMLRQILSACPNLEHLDLTQTAVTDSAFSRCGPGTCHSLSHLDLSGCEQITDSTLLHLTRALGVLPGETEEGMQSQRNACSWSLHGCHDCLPMEGVELETRGSSGGVWLLPEAQLLDIEESGELRLVGLRTPGRWHPSASCGIAACCLREAQGLRAPCGHSFCTSEVGARWSVPGTCNKMVRSHRLEAGTGAAGRGRGAETDCGSAPRSLRFLSLSGCYQITDQGLRALTLHGGLPLLEHLDLSGCLWITGTGLHDLVSACPALNDEYFYYCDNISGPHSTTASGCQNLQCSGRACCRSGE
ncbi:F-box/LRR-repeat protein 5 isoform X2 [Narcine bancroftii]|uniref:F-box/LRR-repeat protein 5 isoform X2 n=1 Tax=Narcine bancroftii TaxID=1343680 RepID=UPI0038320C58